MSNIVRIETNPRRGRAVVYNGMVFVGGQTADDRSQDIRGQTKQTLAKIEKVLLPAQICIKDIAKDFAGMNEIWDARIPPNEAPVRATAKCAMGARDVLVEIIVTAAVCQ